MKNLHLTFDDRLEIEVGLKSGISLTTISKSLNKEYNTIKNEIINKREKIYPSAFNGKRNLCLYFHNKSCTISNLCRSSTCSKECMKCTSHYCNEICNNYVEYICENILKKTFCCNGCQQRKTCRHIKFIYTAKIAQQKYEEMLSGSRQGARITKEQLNYINTVVKKKIQQGQSVDVITHTDSNIEYSTSSLYRYIDNELVDIGNIDLRRKVSMKSRKKSEEYIIKDKSNKIDKLKSTRNYNCFIEMINKCPDYNIAEMDTVIGKKENNKVLLTLLFRKSNFMIAFILNSKSPNAVENKLREFKELIGAELFIYLLKILLTDNGTEFILIEEIEKVDINNKINLFFCDSGKSNQKGKIEKNHEELRKILPKGSNFDKLDQKTINVIISHVNSYPRKILNYKTPYDILKKELGNEKFKFLLEKLNYQIINCDDVVLTPTLLKRIKN